MFLYGKNSVSERLKNNPESIKKIFLQDNFSAPDIEKLIRTKQIPVKSTSKKGLYRIKPAESLQGIVAEVDQFKYSHIEDILNQEPQVSFIFLDRIFDPQNLGAIIRTAACFGGFAVVIPKHKACQITEAVLHVASGGENFVPIAAPANLTNTILAVKKSGFWLVGAFLSGGEDIRKASLPFPLGILLGSEGSGIRYGLEKHVDIKVNIPMSGAPLSFNVTSACAVLAYEVSRQRTA
jgi:23S rRNA (guanosine2251-2'-O)-methyltransferase